MPSSHAVLNDVSTTAVTMNTVTGKMRQHFTSYNPSIRAEGHVNSGLFDTPHHCFAAFMSSWWYQLHSNSCLHLWFYTYVYQDKCGVTS